MRQPNGYGCVTKLSGKRRKPWIVKRTAGTDEETGKQIIEVIGYYESRKDAIKALSDYNHDPYDVALRKSTFSQVYEMLVEQRFPKMGTSLKEQHRAAYKRCKDLYKLPYAELRQFHFQKVIDDCDKGQATQACIKNFFRTMDKYAYDMEIISKMRSVNLTTGKKESTIVRELWTHEEIMKLWELQGQPYIDQTLFMLYTGCRLSEMLTMKCADVELEKGIMRGGAKTEAGKNRVIPIHSKIRPLVERNLSEEEYLFPYPRRDVEDPDRSAARAFNLKWQKAMKDYGFNHKTHECRHTFRTKLDGQNKVCIDLIMGHKTPDVGERVYTHKTIDELKQTIEKLVY